MREVIGALQNETGASISIGDLLSVSGERVVTISAFEVGFFLRVLSCLHCSYPSFFADVSFVYRCLEPRVTRGPLKHKKL